MPKTANTLIQDALIRHQVYLLRLAGSIRNGMNNAMDKTVEELEAALRKRRDLAGMKIMSEAAEKEINRLMNDIAGARKPGYKAAENGAREQLAMLVDNEAEFTAKAISAGIGAEIPFAMPSGAQIENILALGNYAGQNMDQWFSGWANGDMKRIDGTIRGGLAQGKTLDEITRALVGTKKAGYTDGVLNSTRQSAEMMTRTLVNGITNAARDEFYEANADIISAVEFAATLDGRTSEICASLDGKQYKLDDQSRPMPPMHPNCRSLYVPVIDGFGVVGDRPSIGGENFNTAAREAYIEDRVEAGFTQREAAAKWKDLSNSTKNKWRNDQIKKWDKNVIGMAPEKTNYNDWLKTQPAAFQDDVLGKTKAEIFRSGGKDRNGDPVTLSTFIDQNSNKPYTLDQLRVREPQLFREDAKKQQEPKEELKEDQTRAKDLREALLADKTVVKSPEYFDNKINKISAESGEIIGKMAKVKPQSKEWRALNAELQSLRDQRDDLRDQKEKRNAIVEEQRKMLYLPKDKQSKINYGGKGWDQVEPKKLSDAEDFLRGVVSIDVMPDSQLFVNVSDATEREYYRYSGLYLNNRTDAKTIIHEIGHFIDEKAANGSVRDSAVKFRDESAKKAGVESPEWFGGDYSKKEVGYKGVFFDDYAAKVYFDDDGNKIGENEILAVGLQALYENPSKFARDDPDYFDFVVDTIRGNRK